MRGLSLLCLVAAACAGPEFAAPTGDGGSVPVVEVRGLVIDSVTRAPLAGVTVAIAGKFTSTDQGGSFTLAVPPGDDSVHVFASGYERFGRTYAIYSGGATSVLGITLRRLAPFPFGCILSDSGFRAVVLDLQGRKSLDRWSESTLTLVTPTSTRTIAAPDWNYQALDYLQWRVAIPDASLSTVRADWVLFDSEGDVYRGSCEPTTVRPDTAHS